MTRYLGLVFLVACGSSDDPKAKPAGTMSDPVDVCEKVADVCRIDKAKLGVCTQSRTTDRLVCASQH